ncbi:MAG TPA: hypothetical protein VJS42_21925 [Steroidobacteraceae bacterium]|nr:hypothetical protein [Steroidobacteraceae bacterium]
MAKAVLCGSVNLATRDDVFRTVASIAGASMKRISDGETGDRAMWTDVQIPRLSAMPHLEPVQVSGGPKSAFRLRAGADVGDLHFDFGYAQAAIESYRAFAALKKEGAIPRSTRFQVCLPTVAALSMYIDPSSIRAVLPVQERDLLAELRTIVTAIPHDQLAIQWDLACEMAVVERYLPNVFGDRLEDLIEAVVRLASAVPKDVELGFHLCYGDEPGKDGLGHHFMEPRDTADLVKFANALSKRTPRPIGWIHMPVPIERDDDAYFAPLAGLDLASGTELYLGLVHREDGIEGAQRRANTAAKFVTGFGVATECGMGRDPRNVIPTLLRIHTEVTIPN